MGVDTTTLTVNGVRRVFSMGSAFGQVPYSERCSRPCATASA